MTPYVALPDRAFIDVSGPDRFDFLQGLVTQDVRLLSSANPLLYGALLTPQGKYLYDFFLWHEENAILIETDAPRRSELLALLKKYTLRKNVTLEAHDGAVFQIFIPCHPGESRDPRLDSGRRRNDMVGDPRHHALGFRSLQKPDGEERPLEEWIALRLQHNVPDCPKDLRIGLSSPFEGNIDLLNGISFDKGCYMGQELVSRIHHRGLVKRRFPNL